MADNVSIQGLQFEIETKSSDSKLNKGINDFANALKKLGTKSSDASTGLQALNTTLSNLTNLSDLSNLINSLAKLKDIKISPTVATNITKIAEAVDSISAGSIARIQQLSEALQGMNGVSIDFKNVNAPEATTPAEPTMDTASMGGAEELTNAAEGFHTVETSANKAGTALSTFRGIMGGLKNIVVSNVRRIVGIAKGFRDVASAVSGSKLAAGVKTFTSALGKIAWNPGRGLTNLSNKFGQLLSSMKRIAMYRAIRAFFKMLSQGIREGIDNLYHYSAVMGGTFKQSMDSLASSFLYLKNSMGAMVSPLINAIAPAVEYVIDKFVGLLNIVNQFFAALTGKKTTTVAKRVSTTFKEISDDAGNTAGGVSQAAKELKRSILGFDEINALNAPDKGSGGHGSGSGSGGASTPNYADMFETIDVDSGISDWVQDLKDAFNAGDWEELGTLLGNKVNELADRVDWDSLGRKIGYGINGAVQTAYFFLDAVDFEKLGKHFAELLNGAMDEIDFEYLGRLSVKPFTSAADFIIGAFTNIDWKLVGKSLTDGLKGMFNELSEWIQSKDWEEIGGQIEKSIKDFFTGADIGGTAKAISEFIGSALGAAVSLVVGFAKGFVTDIIDVIGKEFTKHREEGHGVISSVLLTILTIDINIVTWVKENIIDPFIKGFTNSSNWSFPDIGGWFMDKIKAAIGFGSDVVKWIKDHLFPNGINFDLGDFKLSLSDTSLAVTLMGVVDKSFDTMKKAWNSVKDSTVVKTIMAVAGKGWTTVKNTWESIKNGTAKKTLLGALGKGWSTVQTAWKGIKDKTVSLKTKVTGGAASIVDKIKSKWEWLKKNGSITIKAKFLDKAYAGIKSAWNSFASKYNSFRSAVNSKLSILHVSLPGPLNYMARGGIVKDPTQAVIGEAGKEAVLPLERNLGWQKTLADQLVSKMGNVSSQSDNSDLIYNETRRQNDLLVQQNRLLAQILEKDPEIRLTTTSIQEGFRKKNLRDGKTVVPVY